MSEDTAGAEIVLEAYGLVTGDRKKSYSHPLHDYTKVVAIFESFTGVKLTVRQAIMFMLSVKFARLRTNEEKGILHHDSLVDAVGYLACLNMIATAQESDKVRTTNLESPTTTTTTRSVPNGQ
jgi:hypothetical protein